MDYLLLGTMTVTDGDRALNLGGYRQRAVLAALLLAADRTLDVDTLTEQVWDGSPPPKPVVSLRAYVANLRRILADDARTDRLVTDGHGYRLRLGADRLDTRQFETQTGLGKRLLDNGDPTRAATVLDGALALWRGSPLSDLRDLQFTYHEIHRFEALRSDAVEARYEAELLRGRSAELIGGLESEVATNPLRERLWAQLMLAMYRAGRRTDALAAYHRLEVILADELGVRPGLALERLAAEIRDESAELDWKPPPDRIQVSRPAARSLFGRIPELTRLHDALTDAADRRGGIAVVTGDSGVGKTALATEVARIADELGMVSAWVGHPGGVRTPPGWAWSQVLRTLTKLNGNTSLNPTPLSIELENFSAGTDFAHLETMAGAVAAQCGHRPTLIVLDDLHRADRSTRDVLELLSSFVNRMPLLVLATWQDAGMNRPMHEREFDRLLSRCEVTLMRLRGLGSDATAQLIARVSGLTPTPEFVESVGTRTGGNAFHITELTRLLCDTGQLDENTTAIASQDVPDAVSGVIRSRMTDVPRSTRTALMVGALLGTEFHAAVAATVLNTDPTEVARDLEPALRAGLITTGTPGRFRFSHGLVRDAVAAQVTGVARAQLHAEIARAYATRDDVATDESFAAADHAWRAGAELEPTIALDLLDRALAAAWERSGYRDIAELSMHGLDACAQLAPGGSRHEREAHLWLQLVSVEAVTKGQNSQEVRGALRRLDDIASRTGQLTLESAFRCLEASGSGRYREAAVLAEGLITVHRETDDPIAGSAGYYLRGLVEFFRNDLEVSIASINTLLHELPTVDWQRHGHLSAFDVRGHGVAIWTAAVRGDATAADAWAQRGLALGDSRNDLFGKAIVRISELQGRAILGQVGGTVSQARAVQAELNELGINQLAASAQVIESWALGREGADTSAAVRAAIDIHTQDGTRIFLPMYYLLLADTELAQGRWDAAEEALRTADTIAAATGERVWDGQLAARRQNLRTAHRSGRIRA